jgi:hypothetical protein
MIAGDTGRAERETAGAVEAAVAGVEREQSTSLVQASPPSATLTHFRLAGLHAAPMSRH